MLGEEGARMEGFGGCLGGDVLVILERVVMQEMHFLLLHHLNVVVSQGLSSGLGKGKLKCYTMQLNCSYLGSV